MYFGKEGFVKVPGINRPSIRVAPVSSQNFSTGVLPYSRADVTATLDIAERPMNFAATSIRESVLLISSMYNPSGFARTINGVIYLVLTGVPTRIPVERIIFSRLSPSCLSTSCPSEFGLGEVILL